jgi:RNA polymerase sigma-70 factor (ECF subfamily)
MIRPLTTPQDVELVQQLREQPGIGIARLYNRYGQLVYSVALRILQDHGAAEEVTQDVFVRCWRGIDHYQPERAPGIMVADNLRAAPRPRARTP